LKPGRLSDLPSRYADAAMAAAVFFAVALASSFIPAWGALERRIFDLLTVFTAKGEVKQPIALVAISEEAMNAMKLQWPWPRTVHADLVERIASGGATVIALDIVFSEPDKEAAGDEVLAAAIRKAGNVVLAADFKYAETAMARVWQRADPVTAFIDAGAIPGLATVPFDPDQFVRRIPHEPDAFWRQIVKVLQIKAPSHPIPPLPDEGALIRYLGPDTVFDPIPYHLVLQASPEELKTVFEGRIVIVGRDLRATPELGLAHSDFFATPFLSYSETLTSGIKVHATLVDNALSGTWLRPMPPVGNTLVATIAAFLSFLLMRQWRPVSTVAMLAVSAMIVVLAWYLFAQQRLWMAVAAPVSVVALAYLAYGVRAYVMESNRKREVQRAFSRYVSPELVEQIVADPSKLALGGESREITVLFTDLAGFTKLTEKFPPPVVQKVLFKHFSAMTEVILRRKGTVVQFIGDAVMAFWGAPLDDPDHALRAVGAAIEMQQAMERLRGELRAQGLPEIHMRIGVNTCVAIVGNMGSNTRLAYTAMGDGINLGARLEGANKFWKTPILVSGETVAKLGGRIPMRRVDRVRVSGKTEAVDVFTPSSDAGLVERTAAAFEAYLQKNWPESAALYGKLLEENPDDGVAKRLLERIEQWRRDPGEATPDGSLALDKL
jgi:adenylate cyclase